MTKLLFTLAVLITINFTAAEFDGEKPLNTTLLSPQGNDHLPDVDQSSQEFYKRIIWSDTEEKLTPEEIVRRGQRKGLKCFKDHALGDLVRDNLENGFDYLQAQLVKGVVPNKRYYLFMKNPRLKLFYFKQGENYFINLEREGEDGETELLARAFREVEIEALPGMPEEATCIRILPENCLWKGQRSVKYEEICRSGMDVGHTLRDDLLRVNFKEHFAGDRSQVDPLIIAALQDCYKPRCYSISYDCFRKGFAFDPQSAVKFLNEQAANFAKKGYFAQVNENNFSITYTRRRVEINYHDGPENPDMINQDFDSRQQILDTTTVRDINSDGTVPETSIGSISVDLGNNPIAAPEVSSAVNLDNSQNP